MPLVRLGKIKPPKTWLDSPVVSARLNLIAVGALVGFLVAMTSIGSGSLLMVFLLLLTPYPLGELVGTDILYGLATMALAGFMHVRMGHFNSGLLLHLVIGSLTRRGDRQPVDQDYSRALFQLAVHRSLFLSGCPPAGGVARSGNQDERNQKSEVRSRSPNGRKLQIRDSQ